MDKINNLLYPCDICHEDCDIDLFYICDDTQTCFNCLAQHAKYKINDGATNISCPYPDHDHNISAKWSLYNISNENSNTYKKLRKNKLNEIMNNKYFVACPQCEFINIQCSENIECFNCGTQYKHDVDNIDNINTDQNIIQDNDSKSEKWKAENTQKCPFCGYHIQKISGCDHVHCTKCKTDFDYSTLKIRSIHNKNHQFEFFLSQKNNRILLQKYRYLFNFVLLNYTEDFLFGMLDGVKNNEKNMNKIDPILKKIHPDNRKFKEIVIKINLDDYIDIIIECPFIDTLYSTQYFVNNSSVKRIKKHKQLLINMSNNKKLLNYFVDKIISTEEFDQILEKNNIVQKLKTSNNFRNLFNTIENNDISYFYKLCGSDILSNEIIDRTYTTLCVLSVVTKSKNLEYIENLYTKDKQTIIGFMNCCDFIDALRDTDLSSSLPHLNILANYFQDENSRKKLAQIGDDHVMNLNDKLRLIRNHTFKKDLIGMMLTMLMFKLMFGIIIIIINYIEDKIPVNN